MLVKAGRVWGEKAPHSNALKPLIEQPIAIYLLTVAVKEGDQEEELIQFGLSGLHCYLLALDQAPSRARKHNQWLRQEMRGSVFM